MVFKHIRECIKVWLEENITQKVKERIRNPQKSSTNYYPKKKLAQANYNCKDV